MNLAKLLKFSLLFQLSIAWADPEIVIKAGDCKILAKTTAEQCSRQKSSPDTQRYSEFISQHMHLITQMYKAPDCTRISENVLNACQYDCPSEIECLWVLSEKKTLAPKTNYAANTLPSLPSINPGFMTYQPPVEEQAKPKKERIELPRIESVSTRPHIIENAENELEGDEMSWIPGSGITNMPTSAIQGSSNGDSQSPNQVIWGKSPIRTRNQKL